MHEFEYGGWRKLSGFCVSFVNSGSFCEGCKIFKVLIAIDRGIDSHRPEILTNADAFLVSPVPNADICNIGAVDIGYSQQYTNRDPWSKENKLPDRAKWPLYTSSGI